MKCSVCGAGPLAYFHTLDGVHYCDEHGQALRAERIAAERVRRTCEVMRRVGLWVALECMANHGQATDTSRRDALVGALQLGQLRLEWR